MSHWTTVSCEFRDQKALEAACRELALPIQANAIARGYGSQTLKADMVIKCPGPYDIAVKRNADGTLGLTTDWWAGHVAKVVGQDFAKLKQLYAVHRATAACRAKGYSVNRVTKQDGSINLAVTGSFN